MNFVFEVFIDDYLPQVTLPLPAQDAEDFEERLLRGLLLGEIEGYIKHTVQ